MGHPYGYSLPLDPYECTERTEITLRKKENKRTIFKNLILNHINSNIKEYFIVIILFLSGIIIGVLFINNINDNGNHEITLYINNFVGNLKGETEINRIALLQESVLSNIKLRFVFVGCRLYRNRYTNCVWNYRL